MKIFKILLLAVITTYGYSQEPSDKYHEKVATLDSTIETLYGVISGEKGEARDWELFKYLFHPEARLIPSSKDNMDKYQAKFITPEGYIERSGQYLIENGFFEKEIYREVDTFGNITQVFSTYNAFHSEKDEKPFMRGINSIQLLHDGERWWILNIYWTQESPENPIPEKYLPKS